MTDNINIQNKPVMPEQLKPALKIVGHSSNDIKEEQDIIQTTTSAKTEKTESKAGEKEATEQALSDAVERMNSYVQSISRNLEFNIDNDSGRTVVKVIDAETEEIIRQIPDEEALEIAKQLDSGLDGDSDSKLLLIRAKA